MAEETALIGIQGLSVRKSESPLRRSFRAILRNPMAMAGLVVIIIWSIVAVFANLIAPYDPIVQDIEHRLAAPSPQHLFGTDQLGRDEASRVIYGAQISLPVGLVVIIFAVIVGLLVGASAGYVGGIYDLLIMRVADITLAFPPIVLAMAIAAVLGPSLNNALIAMIIVWWPIYARLIRSEVLAIKEKDYIQAIRVLGANPFKILAFHVLPNAVDTVIVRASIDFGNAVMFCAALSFIGLGAQPPQPEWGAMVTTGKDYLRDAWWLVTFPGLAIFLTVMGFNLLGDGIRDYLDPRLRGNR